MNIKHFVVENQLEELTPLAEKVEELSKQWELSKAITMNINLAIEEALTNIIFYAFPDNKTHKIKLSLSLRNHLLTIIIKDDGIPFNPLTQHPPDVTLTTEERPVGGLGIFLISQIMDKMLYTRQNNQNILTLNKRLGYEH